MPYDPDEEFCDLDLPWDRIADLAEHRFREDRLLRAVERMVVSKDEEIDRPQDVLWGTALGGAHALVIDSLYTLTFQSFLRARMDTWT